MILRLSDSLCHSLSALGLGWGKCTWLVLCPGSKLGGQHTAKLRGHCPCSRHSCPLLLHALAMGCRL